MANQKKPVKVKPKKKSPARARASGRPVCIAALYCDSAFAGEDKSITIIRTIDTLTFPSAGERKMGTAVELATAARLVVMLKRYDAVGPHKLLVSHVSPSGESSPIGVISQDFSENDTPEMGYNFISPIRFVWKGEGLYWLEVRSMDHQVIARTALRLKVASGQEK